MTTLANVLSILAGAGFLLIGIAAIAQPAILSHLYGLYVHEKNGRGFVRATGARDAALGALLIAFSFTSPIGVLTTLLAGAVVALADFFIVWRTSTAVERVLFAHLFGLVALAVTATIVGMSLLAH